MKLTRTERWLLVNQFKILGKLDPEDTASYNTLVECSRTGMSSSIPGSRRVSAKTKRSSAASNASKFLTSCRCTPH